MVLGVGCYFAWQKDWPSKPLRESGARLERRLNRELSTAGIDDREIAVQVRRERQKWMVVRWVETDREIAMSNLPRAEEMADDLTRTAADEGFDAEKDLIHGFVLLDIKRFGLRFQRLVLFAKNGTPPLPYKKLLKR